MAKGGKAQGLTDAVNALEREIVKTKTQLEITETTLGDDAKRVDAAKTAVKDVSLLPTHVLLLNDLQVRKSLETKRSSTSKSTSTFADFKAAYTAAQADLAKTEELLQTLLTGLSSSNADDENAGGYMGQLAEAKARLAQAGTEAEQAKVKIGLAEKELKEKEPRAKKAGKEGEGLLKELAGKRADVDGLRKRVDGAGWDEGRETELLRKQAESGAEAAGSHGGGSRTEG